MAETVGVERRAKFYEATGALRDMVPNHLFQLLSLIAMGPPNSFGADAVRTEKDKVLEAVRPLDGAEVRRNIVRGQYGAGFINNLPVKGYREEPGVDPASMTETYVAMQLNVDNWRCAGVPFSCGPESGSLAARPRSRSSSSMRRSPCSATRQWMFRHQMTKCARLADTAGGRDLVVIWRKDPRPGDHARRR